MLMEYLGDAEGPAPHLHSITFEPDEARYHFVIRHTQSRQQAFSNAEIGLAKAYNDLSKVLQVKQPETGTYFVKALVPFKVCPFGIDDDCFARYTLKVVVQNTTVAADFDLGPDDQNAFVYAPESEIPKIRDHFKGIAASIAESVGGTLQ